MIEWLGITHLFELSRTEAIAGFFTPLVIFAVFFLAQLILPGKRVPGYVINPQTGKPRNYRLNGIVVFAVALIVWAFELTGMPREWFYRSSIYAVVGGTVFTTIFAIIAVFSQPQGKIKNPLLALWDGRAQEISFFNERFDIKMYFYVVGGTMLALNALSGAAYNYEIFGENYNPGVFLYAAFYTYYILDYFIFERVQLYTYDLIHEGIGFKMFWGGLVIYGWLFILPLWGMAAYPSPGFSSAWTYFWLIGTTALFLFGWGISRGANMQKYTFKRWPDRKFLGIFEPEYIQAGDRKILCSGFWGAARHFNYLGEGFLGLSIALAFGYFTNPWAWTYFVFVVTFFTFRQRFDDAYCAEKYGAEKWAEYQARVKYRILPGIY
ncbi:MAG: ergosterol biosynthesis protein [Candidatus Dadabacteria bacterium]|nr:ergosterol biosynthesis protein [Candidatus Dadabacteria bacterium]MXZ13774.1 ergosterol biosynthesis protein [Candidatus Dadabacteria bacterium]MYA48112.1 ergosterol biosynthesis protein [Candidatus Dadabacteria bacterium]MYC40322.1 ergosterol biosynthesis protein [Candidatus Dadabacteria bacterium]MYF48328.1 ergosterol biosynthesis protein [Candidatus Dadabacteria bacterium]